MHYVSTMRVISFKKKSDLIKDQQHSLIPLTLTHVLHCTTSVIHIIFIPLYETQSTYIVEVLLYKK